MIVNQIFLETHHDKLFIMLKCLFGFGVSKVKKSSYNYLLLIITYLCTY